VPGKQEEFLKSCKTQLKHAVLLNVVLIIKKMEMKCCSFNEIINYLNGMAVDRTSNLREIIE